MFRAPPATKVFVQAELLRFHEQLLPIIDDVVFRTATDGVCDEALAHIDWQDGPLNCRLMSLLLGLNSNAEQLNTFIQTVIVLLPSNKRSRLDPNLIATCRSCVGMTIQHKVLVPDASESTMTCDRGLPREQSIGAHDGPVVMGEPQATHVDRAPIPPVEQLQTPESGYNASGTADGCPPPVIVDAGIHEFAHTDGTAAAARLVALTVLALLLAFANTSAPRQETGQRTVYVPIRIDGPTCPQTQPELLGLVERELTAARSMRFLHAHGARGHIQTATVYLSLYGTCFPGPSSKVELIEVEIQKVDIGLPRIKINTWAGGCSSFRQADCIVP